MLRCHPPGDGLVVSSRPERSVVERSAVPSSSYSPQKRRPPLCHLDRSAAQWRDLRSPPAATLPEAPPSPLSSRPERSVVERSALPSSSYSPRKCNPPLCHLDRSAAQWRDLRFIGPFLEMFFSAKCAN